MTTFSQSISQSVSHSQSVSQSVAAASAMGKSGVEVAVDSSGVDALLKIGEVATRSGLPVKTIRYYEEIGLLAPTVERSETGYRMFSVEVFNRLAFIRRSQTLGLSLQEIQQILQIRDRGQLPCSEVRQQLQTKVSAITQQIESLEQLKHQLQDILSDWQEFEQDDRTLESICPNLQRLAD